MDTLLALDHAILSYIALHFQNGLLTAVMRFCSALGNLGAVWIVLTLFLLARHKTRRCGIIMAAALLAGVLLGEGLLKHLISRPRPFLQFDDLTPLIPPPQSFSFPSGHSLSSFAAATALFSFYRKPGICAFALAAAIAFSRLYLCVHFPTDVFAGLILGITVGLAAYFIGNRVLDRLHYARLR